MNPFLTEFIKMQKHPHDPLPGTNPWETDWDRALESLEIDRTVKPVDWLKGGATGGLDVLNTFITKKMKIYQASRNDPNTDALSNMSPYYHFGQVSPHRGAIEALTKGTNRAAIHSFF
eukprot:Colp12_sorted_trinity150504_noHs@11974